MKAHTPTPDPLEDEKDPSRKDPPLPPDEEPETPRREPPDPDTSHPMRVS